MMGAKQSSLDRKYVSQPESPSPVHWRYRSQQQRAFLPPPPPPYQQDIDKVNIAVSTKNENSFVYSGSEAVTNHPRKWNAANHSYKSASNVPMLDCPVCMETMCAPILQCRRGHSLCNTCTTALKDGLCPICRDEMTTMRNFQLEQVVGDVKYHCPNKPCVYTVKYSEMDDHLKECIYRQMDCPLGIANGKCSWTGTCTEMLAHFDERHPACRVKLDVNFGLHNLKADEDERLVFLTNHGKHLFTITFRIDILQKMCYFVVQHIGTRHVAHSFFYEIQIFSQVDSRRQITFKDNCFSDVMKADEVYQLGECAMLPLTLLPHFLKNKMLSFRFSLARPGGPYNNQKFHDPRPSSSNSFCPPQGPRERGHNFKPRGRSHSRGSPHQGGQPRKWVTKSSNDV